MSNPFSGVPEGWEVSRLDRVSSVRARIGWKALTASEYQREGYAFLSTPNIKSREIDFQNVNYISTHRYNESPDLKLQVGDVLLVKDGNTLGITNIVRHLPRPATVNGSIAVLRPFRIDPTFLLYALTSNATQGRISAVKDGMGVPHLFQADIKKFPLPLPPMDEQRRIADFLDTETAHIDALIRAYSRTAELLRERFIALADSEIRSACTTEAPLRRFLVRPPEYGAQYSGDIGESKWPRYIRITDLTEDGKLRDGDIKRLSFDKARPYMLDDGDILLARSGATVGKGFLYRKSMGSSCFAGYLIRIKAAENVSPQYISLWLRTKHYWDQINTSSVQSTIQNISAERYGSLSFPFVDPQVQRGIVELLLRERLKLESIEERIGRQQALLKERRQALIAAAVTGQIDVTTARSGVR